MIYAETVLEIWIDVGIGILLVFFAIQGLRKALKQNSRKTELRMLVSIKAERLKIKSENRRTRENGGNETIEIRKRL